MIKTYCQDTAFSLKWFGYLGLSENESEPQPLLLPHLLLQVVKKSPKMSWKDTEKSWKLNMSYKKMKENKEAVGVSFQQYCHNVCFSFFFTMRQFWMNKTGSVCKGLRMFKPQSCSFWTKKSGLGYMSILPPTFDFFPQKIDKSLFVFFIRSPWKKITDFSFEVRLALHLVVFQSNFRIKSPPLQR